MPLRKLEKSDWRYYSAHLSKALANRRSEANTASLAVSRQVAAEWVPLLGVTYETKEDLFEIALQHLEHRVRFPRTIYVDEGPKGTAGFEVIDFAGLRHSVQLSHPVKITSVAVEKRDDDIGGPANRGGDSPLQGLDAISMRMECARGQQIYKQHSSVEYWYRIETGAARRFSARTNGTRQIVDLMLPGDFFGFGVRGKHHFAVDAVLDGTIIALYPCSRLESLAALDPHVARELWDAARAAMSRQNALILNLGRTTAEQKVGHFLVKMAERLAGGHADKLVLPISREDIAGYLALSVETVSRSLTQLKRREIIRLTGTREIRILDRSALAKGDEDQTRIRDPLRTTEPPPASSSLL
jgi:CRP/FNR family transcriptional regulator, nitrogen fixation regulation protein